jgi:hypothetical protein
MTKLSNQDNYEQYVPQPAKVAEDNAWKPASFSSEYGSQYQTNGSANPKLTEDFEQQILRAQQIQKYQLQQSMEDPSLTFGGYGYSTNSEQAAAPLYQPPVENIPIEAPNPKKKKEKRKKKKSRRKSSSSSSSSSNSSSGSRKRRKSVRHLRFKK